MYRDPELTKYGIEMCQARKWDLRRLIEETFGGDAPYHVGSSALLRAQQTAFYQLLDGDPAHKLNIIPHIAETTTVPQDDITPLPAADQLALLPPALAANMGQDGRMSLGTLTHDPSLKEDPKSHTERSNWRSFLRWLLLIEQNNTVGKFFPRRITDPSNSRTARRAVFFSHGGFIKKNLGFFAHNNDVFYITIDTSTPGNIKIGRAVQLARYRLDPAKMVILDGCSRGHVEPAEENFVSAVAGSEGAPVAGNGSVAAPGNGSVAAPGNGNGYWYNRPYTNRGGSRRRRRRNRRRTARR